MVTHDTEGPMEAFKGALKLFCTRDMLLLSVTFIYTGKQDTPPTPLTYECVPYSKRFKVISTMLSYIKADYNFRKHGLKLKQ